MNRADRRVLLLRLALARACAWGLLIAGWVGVGALALQYAPSPSIGFAWVGLWLLALGATATIVTRGSARPLTRALLLGTVAAATAVALWSAVRGGGLIAMVVALLGWAALTALASGVVRSLRLAQSTVPTPPVAAASLGALSAGLMIGDPGDLPTLTAHLAWSVLGVAIILMALQRHRVDRPGSPGCRAGLFDCSLPAWPTGAWHDPLQWPVLLAGLAMLPMMATLPLMAAWCRAQSIEPQVDVLLHLAAMFVPALVLRGSIARWSSRTLAVVCTLLLATGGALAAWAPAPTNLLGLTAAHGAAWGMAWSGQLWAPGRRGREGSSPLHAAIGYALVTGLFGLAVERSGVHGVIGVHALLGLAAVMAMGLAAARSKPVPPSERRHHGGEPPHPVEAAGSGKAAR